MSVFLTSDLHFNHDREFVWKVRGFDSVQEMNEAIIKNINRLSMFVLYWAAMLL